MSNTLTITDNRTGKQYEIPITNGMIRAIDLRQIKVDPNEFGMMSYDPAFLNTANCQSRITYIDGDKGILRYRGYPIEQLAEKGDFLIWGMMPVAIIFAASALTLFVVSALTRPPSQATVQKFFISKRS